MEWGPGYRCIFFLLLVLIAPAQALAGNYPRVLLAEVTREAIAEDLPLTGTVNALRSSQVSSAVAGLILEVKAEPGQAVARGELLMSLDDEQTGFELASARAESREAGARLAEARRRLAEARSVGAGRNIAATEISARESEAEAAAAALARLQAVEQRLQVVLARHRITAPFDGVVSERSRDLGEWVTPGDALLTLVDTRNLRLDFRVPQDYFRQLTAEGEARLSVRTPGAGQELVAVDIDTVVPVTDPQARTFLIRAVGSRDLDLMPGMSVRGQLRVAVNRDGLTIPRDALNRYPDGRVTVWIAEPADDEGQYQVREKRVRTGTGFGDRVEITDGLEGGEQLVSRGNEALDEGMTVTTAESGDGSGR